VGKVCPPNYRSAGSSFEVVAQPANCGRDDSKEGLHGGNLRRWEKPAWLRSLFHSIFSAKYLTTSWGEDRQEDCRGRWQRGNVNDLGTWLETMTISGCKPLTFVEPSGYLLVADGIRQIYLGLGNRNSGSGDLSERALSHFFLALNKGGPRFAVGN